MRSALPDATQLTPYELRNLVAHLDAAGQADTVHRLLALETDAGTNFWFEAKDERDPGGYVTDAQRGLRLARQVVDARLKSGLPADGVALEVRYGLLIASVRTAGRKVPPALLTALVEKRVRSAEDVLAYLSQISDGPPRPEVIASLAPHLSEPVRTRQLREVLRDLGSIGEGLDEDVQREDALAALAPVLPQDLMGEALSVARNIGWGHARAKALATLGPHVPDPLRDEGVAAAAEIQNASLRIAALVAMGEAVSRKSLRAALAQGPDTIDPDRVEASIVLAATLPPELLGEVLTAARNFGPNRCRVLTALALRLPDDLLAEAVTIVKDLHRFDDPGRALAALAPRLSGETLVGALNSLAHFREPSDKIWALNELALRYPEHERDKILARSLQIAERARYTTISAPEVVRLAELLPRRLLRRALALARKIDPRNGGTAVLVAVGERLDGPDRETVLREALRDTSRIDDEELRSAATTTSGDVLARLARLLPGEVLSFVLEDVRPHDRDDSSWERLSAIAPHLQTDELRQALRAVREVQDGREQCAAVAALADLVDEPDRSELLRSSLDACRRIPRQWDQTMALHALGPKLSEDLGAVALDIAESIEYEAGARARAEVARAVPPMLVSRAVASINPAYEGWKAVAFAALAKKAKGPTRIKLFRQSLATVGETDWDDTQAQGVGFISELAPDLPKQLLDEALETALHGFSYDDARKRSSALVALARRFEGAQRAAILEEALTVVQDVNDDSDRVQALVDIGVEVPGVAEALRQVGDMKWRAVGLAELGEPAPEEALRTPIGSLSDLADVQATLRLLPFSSPDRVRAVLAELPERDGWARLAEGSWFSNELAGLVPRLGVAFIPDLLALADRLPPADRLPLLAALAKTFQPLEPERLHDCWIQARASLDGVTRSKALESLASSAVIIDAVGGRTGVRDSAASVHLVARWHP